MLTWKHSVLEGDQSPTSNTINGVDKLLLELSITSTVLTDDQQQVDGRPLRISRAAVTTQFVVRVFPQTCDHLATRQRTTNG